MANDFQVYFALFVGNRACGTAEQRKTLTLHTIPIDGAITCNGEFRAFSCVLPVRGYSYQYLSYQSLM